MARKKSKLKGVITMAAHVFCEPVTVACIRQAKTNYETHGLKQGLEKYHGKNTDNAFYGWNDIWLNPHFVHWNIEKYLGRITVPMLAIQGGEDQYGTLRQMEVIRSRVRRIQTCVIDDCRHSPHLEQPQKVLEIMAGFIREILAR
jgi:pimeloyl-ACP methyl ester carboxylesterase